LMSTALRSAVIDIDLSFWLAAGKSRRRFVSAEPGCRPGRSLAPWGLGPKVRGLYRIFAQAPAKSGPQGRQTRPWRLGFGAVVNIRGVPAP